MKRFNKTKINAKKILSSALALAFSASSLISLNLNASAAEIPAPYSLDIPKASFAPDLDGSVDTNGEWKGAWHSRLDTKSPGFVRTDDLKEPYDTTYDFYMMWDENNLYFACVAIGDKTIAPKMTTGKDTQDNGKRGDGFQIYINPSNEIGENDQPYFWSDFYAEYADGVKPFWWEYKVFDGDNVDKMAQPLNIDVAPRRNGENWTIEVKIPWADLLVTPEGANNQFNFSVPMKAGDKVTIEFHTMDFTGDSAYSRRLGLMPIEEGEDAYSLETFYKYKLVDTVAGLALAEVEGKGFDTVTPVVTVDNPTPSVVATTTTVVAPVTGDNSVIFVLIGLAVVGFTTVIVGKRKVNE